MRKFLTVSVCLFASLIAKANVNVTKSADGNADSITISGTLTDEEVATAKQQLSKTSVKIATGNYQLTMEDWEKVIASGKLITDGVTDLDLSDTRFASEVLTKNNLGDKIGNRNNISAVTLSRYCDVPDQCFNSNGTLISITIPNRKDGDESITICREAFSAMSQLTSLNIGNCVTNMEEGMCRCSYIGQSKLKKVIFNTPQITELPVAAFQYCKALTKIDLPTNLKEIGEGAFEYCSLETITFPLTLTTIRRNAFHDCNLKYVVIPRNVTLIETEAFQQNAKLADVYIMGNNVKCQENGFDKKQNNQGFINESAGMTEDNPATREDWVKYDKTHPVVLHYIADGEESNGIYENPYYTMLNTDNILAELQTCTDDAQKDAFVEKYNLYNGFPWDLYYFANDRNCKCPFAYYKYKDNDGKDKICKIWRAEYGYYAGIQIKELDPDYAGWKQFLIIQDDAKQNTFEDEHRIDDRWYSMCFPFNLNAKQIRTAYGAGTEVCEFIGVWNTHTLNEDGEEIVTFRYKTLLSSDDQEAIDEDQKSRSAEPIITKANHAYMIHPASKKEGDNTDVWYRIIPDIPKENQEGNQNDIIPTRPEHDMDEETLNKFAKNGSELIPGFEFVGNYSIHEKLPADSYYFAYRDHADGSRSLILNHLTKESKHDWTPMTALVRPYAENANMANFAKKFAFSFSSEQQEETTGIQEIKSYLNMGYSAANNKKIYNLSGQVVKAQANTQDLSKGVYIINGKKYVVK